MTDDLLQLAREAIEDDKRATPGPWIAELDQFNNEDGIEAIVSNATTDLLFCEPVGIMISGYDAKVWTPELEAEKNDCWRRAHDTPQLANARWIAAARTREPLLAAEVLRLTERHAAEVLQVDDVNRNVNADNKRLRAERDSLKTHLAKQIDVWDVERKAMESQLAAMTAARDEACDMLSRVIAALNDYGETPADDRQIGDVADADDVAAAEQRFEAWSRAISVFGGHRYFRGRRIAELRAVGNEEKR